MSSTNWRGKVIFHVDMNSFYASVEQVHDPSLEGKPVAIAGDPKERRGIVVTASYEARAYGVKTTMPVWEARRKCPPLIVRPPDFDKYRAASAEIFHLLEEYTPLVEPVSIDEGYMDVTQYYPEKNPADLAEEIQARIKRELGLSCSIGVAPNKFLAKMASDMKKPMGITILRKRELDKLLWPLPIEEMHGVGKKTAEKLKEWNIYKVGDLAAYSETDLNARFGVKGRKLYERANGVDPRMVDPDAAKEVKSVGSSTTLSQDINDKSQLLKVISVLAKKVENRLQRKKVCSSTIQIVIRYNNRNTITRSKTLLNPLLTADEIEYQAKYLFEEYWNEDPVRLIGITALHVIPIHEAYRQLTLF